MLVKGVAVTNNLGLDHFAKQVVTLTSTLTDTGEHRKTLGTDRDVVDQLHNENRFAHAGTAKEADLTTAKERLNKVDDLDPRLKHFERC